MVNGSLTDEDIVESVNRSQNYEDDNSDVKEEMLTEGRNAVLEQIAFIICEAPLYLIEIEKSKGITHTCMGGLLLTTNDILNCVVYQRLWGYPTACQVLKGVHKFKSLY